MTKDEALKLALEALNSGVDAQVGRVVWTEYDSCLIVEAITAIKEALAQPEQEPVAWLLYKNNHKESFWLDKGDAYALELTPEHRWEPLYTTPPQRKPLTDEEIERIYDRYGGNMTNCARAIERAHGIKENT